MRLKEKVIIVTGAAQGLGKAFSLALAREGAKIVVVDIADSGATEKEIEASGSKVRALRTAAPVPTEG